MRGVAYSTLLPASSVALSLIVLRPSALQLTDPVQLESFPSVIPLFNVFHTSASVEYSTEETLEVKSVAFTAIEI